VLASAELFTALKLVGAAYLVWIGLRAFQSARRDASAVLSGGSTATPVGARRAFHEGVLVEALNPKTTAFFLAFVPQFVDPTQGHVALQFVALGFVSVALSFEELTCSGGNWNPTFSGGGPRSRTHPSLSSRGFPDRFPECQSSDLFLPRNLAHRPARRSPSTGSGCEAGGCSVLRSRSVGRTPR